MLEVQKVFTPGPKCQKLTGKPKSWTKKAQTEAPQHRPSCTCVSPREREDPSRAESHINEQGIMLLGTAPGEHGCEVC